jgi:hypothetical protein
MIVNLKLETEARCACCGKIAIVERSQMLCLRCFGYWVEYVNWLHTLQPGAEFVWSGGGRCQRSS